MSAVQNYRMNIAAPNLMNICVDDRAGGELRGRIYHGYQEEPVSFANIIELIRGAEELFDRIAFPQASTKARTLVENDKHRTMPAARPERVLSPADVLNHAGKLGTFVTSVRFRQNATWQGEVFWVEKEMRQPFTNTLEFIKQIDRL